MGQAIGDGERRSRPLWLEVSVLLSLAAAAGGFVKVWAFAHGNPETLQIVLAAGGLGPVFYTSLATSVSMLAVIAGFFAAVLFGEALREDDAWRPPAHALGLLIILCIAVAPKFPTFALALFAGYQVAYGVTAKLWRRWASLSADRKVPWLLRLSGVPRKNIAARGYLVFVAAAALVVGLLSSPPWIAVERVDLKAGIEPLTGYMMEDQSDFLVFVEEESRQPVVLNVVDIESRTVCRPEWGPLLGGRSILASWFWRSPTLLEPCSPEDAGPASS